MYVPDFDFNPHFVMDTKLMLQEINATQINENLISWSINFL